MRRISCPVCGDALKIVTQGNTCNTFGLTKKESRFHIILACGKRVNKNRCSFMLEIFERSKSKALRVLYKSLRRQKLEAQSA